MLDQRLCLDQSLVNGGHQLQQDVELRSAVHQTVALSVGRLQQRALLLHDLDTVFGLGRFFLLCGAALLTRLLL